ncbi:hypothetical protein FQZ97_845490 [compost metagenome]
MSVSFAAFAVEDKEAVLPPPLAVSVAVSLTAAPTHTFSSASVVLLRVLVISQTATSPLTNVTDPAP